MPKVLIRNWIIVGAPVVTLIVGFGIIFDSINTIKLFALGMVAIFALNEITTAVSENPRILFSPEFVVAKLFVLSLCVPLIFTDAPLAQQMYGTSGRYLGFLHYLSLTLILLGLATKKSKIPLTRLFNSLVFVGVLESIYGYLQFCRIDPVDWRNPDGWIIGTFGNPNYFSSFLALSTMATVYSIHSRNHFSKKLFYCICAISQFGGIIISHSSQGLIMLAVGFLMMLSFMLFLRSKLLAYLLGIFGFLSGILALLGIFQKGPGKDIFYQVSISYRGDYWRAGLRMFKSNWQHGVGLDSFGDYYRLYRDSVAAERRGLDLVSNSAHNLFIDLASTGGLLLLVSYTLILILVLYRIFYRFQSSARSDMDYKILVSLWVVFNLQTLISINVPSLAIWGWLLSGLLLSYDKVERHPKSSFKNQKVISPKSRTILSYGLGLTILFPSLLLVYRDYNIANALSNNHIPTITDSLLSYPRDATQIASVAAAYEKFGKSRESLNLAKASILENPRSFNAWEVVFLSPVATEPEERAAAIRLRALDPFWFEKSD